jgi:RNA polymerase sigma factor (sigma-70 family)
VKTAETVNLATLVSASLDGDADAWNEIVARYARLVGTVTRRYRLSAPDAQDVIQTVWLNLVEHLARLRDPAALPRWLVTTAEHECQRQVRNRGRSRAIDPSDVTHLTDADSGPIDEELLAAERHQVLRDGLAELSAHHRNLLTLLATDPPPTYEEISRILGIPIGSIGPTRIRALQQLRASRAVQTYLGVVDEAARTGGARHALAEME